MTWHDYREIRERVRIVDLLEELGWQATKTRGAQLRGSCPYQVVAARQHSAVRVHLNGYSRCNMIATSTDAFVAVQREA